MNANLKSSLFPLIIMGFLFFILGFVTWLNGILIPHLKIACELTNFQSLFVAFAFYISFTVMALPSSWILKKTGFKNGISISLIIMGIGAIVFIPAAITRVYFYFLTGLFILGSGMALLQTAVNPYITVLGPIESAAKRISIMGIANKIAGAIAPLILAYFIVKDGDDTFKDSLINLSETAKQLKLDQWASRVINPYIVMSAILILLGIAMKFIKLPKINLSANKETITENDNKKTNIFQFPYLILGVVALFFYVGVEVIAGDTIIRYGQFLGFEMEYAKAFTTYTLTAMLIGYILSIVLIPKYISQQKALQISAILGVIFSVMAIFTNGAVSVFFIAVLGLANAVVWPAIWPLAIAKLGKFTNTGSALLIMAISGGAILPLLWGKFIDLALPSTEILDKLKFSDINKFNELNANAAQNAYWVLVPGYLFIFYYAIKGYKIGKNT